MPSLDDRPMMKLARDVWDLNDDQLWEVLEALQMKMARREEMAPPHWLPQGIRGPPGMAVKLKWMMGKWTPDGELDGDMASTHSGPQVPSGWCTCWLSPRKTKVSFQQWYHEVQSIKDHYREVVVWESIIWSLNWTVADMAKYMGPNTSVAHILYKLSVIFCMVALFNILMKNFYKVSQGSNGRFPPLLWG